MFNHLVMIKILHNNKIITRKVVLSVFLLCFVAIICICSRASLAEEKDLKSDKQYWLDGMYYYADRSYTSAAEQFEALTKHYPYSKYTHNALLMELYTNFIDDEKEKISGIAEVFYHLFPLDNDTPYVMYMQAMAEFTALKDESRMLDKMVEGEKLFFKLKQYFADSVYTKDAEKKLEYLNAVKQLNYIHVGEIYLQRDDYIGAMKRYTGIFNSFPDDLHPLIEEFALCRLFSLTKMLISNTEAEKYNQMLNDKYPNSKCFVK